MNATKVSSDANPRASGVATLAVLGRTQQLEYERIAADRCAPLIVFLHEGLGSLGMWRDFPRQLCAAAGARGLVYSRLGYGRSTPRAADEKWPVDFMHRQARDILPALLAHLSIAEPVWLFGHSDGASIALLHAATFEVAGLVVVAPHVFVEDISIASIEQARAAYETTDLRERLARYHADPDSAFRGWNDAWLAPTFRSWNIEAELDAIRCPVLAVQGADDEYGTLAQIQTIQTRLPKTRLLVIPKCGHSPHRDQPELVATQAGRFIHEHSPS